MKKIIVFLMIAYSSSLLAQQSAYVYGDSILLSIPEYVQNMNKLDSIKNSQQKELEKNNLELQQRYNNLIKPYQPKDNETLSSLKSRMTPSDTLNLSLLLDENKMYQKKVWNYDNATKLYYTLKIQPIMERINKVISDYATSNKLFSVYIMEQIRSTIAYIDPKKDITKAIIQRVKTKK